MQRPPGPQATPFYKSIIAEKNAICQEKDGKNSARRGKQEEIPRRGGDRGPVFRREEQQQVGLPGHAPVPPAAAVGGIAGLQKMYLVTPGENGKVALAGGLVPVGGLLFLGEEALEARGEGRRVF